MSTAPLPEIAPSGEPPVDGGAISGPTNDRGGRRLLLARFVRHPLGVLAATYLVFLLVVAVAPGLFTSQSPDAIDFLHVLSGPSTQHLLGTDSLGRDTLTRLLYGTGSAVQGVLIALGVASAVGIPLGLASALSRPLDMALSRISDLALSIPGIVVLLMVLALAGSLDWAMAAFGLLTAPGLLRLVRGASLPVTAEPYIAAAQVAGVSRPVIAFRHILPRVAGPVIVTLSLLCSNALITAVGLNFLGLGISPPSPTWGSMLSDGAAVMDQQSWTIVPPGAVVALTVIALVLFGDALRDSMAETWSSTTHRRVRKLPASARPSDEETDWSPAKEAGRDTALVVKGLSVAFPGTERRPVTAIQNVSFDIEQGEAVGIVGESGCGKTITGLAVLGLLPAGAALTSGEIWIGQTNVTQLDRTKRAALRGKEVAFVSQEPMMALDPLFTVGTQIAEFVRQWTGMGRAASKRRVIELLTLVRIPNPERVMKAYPHQISGGMAQRVAIAIALTGNPKLLIADEPTTALDVTVQSQIIELLRSLQTEQNMSILLISHDWGVVSELCSRAVVMYAGEVVERASVAQVLEVPLHPYSEGLIEASPHFVVPGERLRALPGVVLKPGEWPQSCHFQDRCPYVQDDCRHQRVDMRSLGGGRASRCLHIDALSGEIRVDA